MFFQDLKLYIWKISPQTNFDDLIFCSAIEFWKGAWEDVESELNIKSRCSERIFNQDYFLSLFYKNEPVAASTINQLNILNLNPSAQHFFGSNYNKELREYLLFQKIAEAISFEHFIISTEFRKMKPGFSIAEFMAYFSFKFQIEKKFSFSIAHCRKDRKVDLLLQNFGAKPLLSAGIYNGSASANVITEKSEITFDHFRGGMASLEVAQEIWNQKSLFENTDLDFKDILAS